MGIFTRPLRNMHDIMRCLHSIDAIGRILPDPSRYKYYIYQSTGINTTIICQKRNRKYTYNPQLIFYHSKNRS